MDVADNNDYTDEGAMVTTMMTMMLMFFDTFSLMSVEGMVVAFVLSVLSTRRVLSRQLAPKILDNSMFSIFLCFFLFWTTIFARGWDTNILLCQEEMERLQKACHLRGV